MRRRRGEDASVLMLVPAAVLVLIVLGAICVDSAIVFMAQRDLANRTAATANDIAGFAVSDAAFYAEEGVVLDDDRADAYAQLVFSLDRLPGGFETWAATANTTGHQVTVTATAEVRSVFASSVPGGPHATLVRARSVSSLREG